MRNHWSVLALVLIATGLVLSACGGGGAGGDPVSTVQEVFRRMEAKQFNNLGELVCADKKDEFTQQMDFSASMSTAFPGIDAQQVLDALSIKVSNLSVTEVSRSGNEAVVHVKGTLGISIDPEKFKPILKEMLKAQGLGDVDDATLDQFIDPIVEQAEQGTDIDNDVTMTNEGGKWLICGDLVTP